MTIDSPNDSDASKDRPDLTSAFRWALDATSHPGNAAADWLAAEIVPGCTSASQAVASPTTTLDQLLALKEAFKALRTGGTSAAEKNHAARMYAGTIAAALVHHKTRITKNGDAALRLAFLALCDDDAMEEPVRDLAETAAKLVKSS